MIHRLLVSLKDGREWRISSDRIKSMVYVCQDIDPRTDIYSYSIIRVPVQPLMDRTDIVEFKAMLDMAQYLVELTDRVAGKTCAEAAEKAELV